MAAIQAPKDFWAGVLYAAFGVGALAVGSGYPFGTAARMGPGYFPVVLGSILVLFGLVAILRSFARSGEPVDPIACKALGLVVAGVVLFAWLLPRLGMPLALLAVILVPASASQHFRLGVKPLLLLLALIAFCVAVFVEGLGVPMPLLGTWLKG